MSIILNFFKKIVKSAGSKPEAEAPKVRIYPRSEHTISRAQISEHALKVLYRLQKSGYDAYLVGGCVRDLLLGREPKDFDVVTNAHPEQIKGVFRNCRLIGRRFRLAHVHFGNEVIEVATFRGFGSEQDDDQVTNDEGRLLRDNVYGTIEQDVWRRDFTVNALYYNIKDFSVVDYTGGMDDHKAGMLRLIGDPETRFREDPVRMLRAVRFAVKLGFNIDPDCQKAIYGSADLLYSIPSARLYDEVLKLFLSGFALQTFEMLRHYGLFQVLFPDAEKSLAVEENGFPKLLLIKALQNSDNRIAEGKTVTPYFLLAALLWEPLRMLTQINQERGLDDYNAFQSAASEILSRQVRRTAFPRHISLAMREVWSLQPKFEQRGGPPPAPPVSPPRFGAAHPFVLLRAETGDADAELADWWSKFQLADEAVQKKMTQPSRNLKNSRTRRRRNGKKKNAGPTENPPS
jgi:poly(A) polymerase